MTIMNKNLIKNLIKISLVIMLLIGLTFSVYSENINKNNYTKNNLKISDNLRNKLDNNDNAKINVLVLTNKNNLNIKKDLINKKYSNLGIYDLTLTKKEINELLKNNNVTYIDENIKYHSLMLEKSEPFLTSFKNNKKYNNLTGKGIKVAVIDSGIDENNEFLKNNIIKSVDFSYDGTTTDFYGHGTHVAGIIKNVAPNIKLMNVKVLNINGEGTSSSVIAGIEYAYRNKADIISLSLGSDQIEQDYFMNIVLQKAIDSGTKVVVAAGNCGEGCISSPGNYEKVITVGAIDYKEDVAYFSSGYDYGTYKKPDIVAPGVDINSTVLSNLFEEYSGTSMATPHVTGIVALMLEKNKNMPQFQVKKILESTAIDKGEKGKDIRYGSGIPNFNLIFEMIKTKG